MTQKPCVTVLFGSQTGMAQDMAEEYGVMLARRGFPCQVLGCNDYPLENLPTERLLIIFMSTMGDGEVPDNAKQFWRFLLRKDLAASSLSAVRFAIFGLGDSSYTKFNAAARKMHARLLQLGAVVLCERGLGDEQHVYGMEYQLEEWSKNQCLPALYPAFLADYDEYVHQVKKLGLEYAPRSLLSMEATPVPSLFPCRYVLEVRVPLGEASAIHRNNTAVDGTLHIEAAATSMSKYGDDMQCLDGVTQCPTDSNSESAASAVGRADLQQPSVTTASTIAASSITMISPDWKPRWDEYSAEAAVAWQPIVPPPSSCYDGRVLAQLTDKQRITAEDWQQDIQHFTFRMQQPHYIRYKAGDVAVVYPHNSEQIIQQASQLFNIPLDATLNISFNDAVDAPGRLSYPSTLTFAALLGCYLDITAVPSRSFFEQLAFFARDAEQQEKLWELASAAGADLYNTYCTRERHSILEVLQEFTSVKLPLEYALQLIPPIRPRQFSIASAETYGPGVIELCVGIVQYTTRFGRRITGLCSSWLATLPIHSFVPVYIMPGTFDALKASQPLILVGPGTGIAPMRSIIQERIAVSARGAELPPLWLFRGCRSSSKDWVYHEELAQCNEAVVRGGWARNETAFSRDGGPKRYVQNVMTDAAAHLASLILTNGAAVYISGSAKRMPSDVVACVKDILVSHGGLDEADATRYIAMMERTKRLVVEAWS